MEPEVIFSLVSDRYCKKKSVIYMGGGACRQGDCSFPPKKITPLPLQNVAVGNIV